MDRVYRDLNETSLILLPIAPLDRIDIPLNCRLHFRDNFAIAANVFRGYDRGLKVE